MWVHMLHVWGLYSSPHIKSFGYLGDLSSQVSSHLFGLFLVIPDVIKSFRVLDLLMALSLPFFFLGFLYCNFTLIEFYGGSGVNKIRLINGCGHISNWQGRL